MKKILASLVAVLAVACIAIGLRAANSASAIDLSQVKVTAYRGTTPLLSMSGAECAAVFQALPADVKTGIANEWDRFAPNVPRQGSISGVKYAFKDDLTLEYGGYKVVAAHVTPELIGRILSTVE